MKVIIIKICNFIGVYAVLFAGILALTITDVWNPHVPTALILPAVLAYFVVRDNTQ